MSTDAAVSVWDLAADIFDPPPVTPKWDPQPKQVLATELASQAVETLYGGAAGGGKTEWLINYAAEEMERWPLNRGAIFRRVFPSLARTIVPRARLLLERSGRARYRGDRGEFHFPNGSVLELNSLQYADSIHDYQGAEYGLIAFEEITEFMQSQWEFLIGRLRAPAEGIRPHAIATTNPGGRGHVWVKRRWVKPKPEDYTGDEAPEAFEVWQPKPNEDVPNPGKRVFVPSTIHDNPALLARDPEYLSRLQGSISNRGLRAALVEGDWDAIDAVEGALWSRQALEDGRVKPDPRRVLARRVIAVDPSDGNETGDEFGVCIASRGMNGVGYVELSDGWNAGPREMAKRAIELYRDYDCDAIVIEKNHGGKWLKQVFIDVDPYANIQMVWASESKKTRAEPVAALFVRDTDIDLDFRARMVGVHEELEDELITYTGEKGMVSPNRLDAMVWALTDLCVGSRKIKTTVATDLRHRGRR